MSGADGRRTDDDRSRTRSAAGGVLDVARLVVEAVSLLCLVAVFVVAVVGGMAGTPRRPDADTRRRE